MELNLKSKKAIVCAASKGLGFAVADRLYAEGCDVIICARNEKDLLIAAENIKKKHPNGRSLHPIAVDLSKSTDIHALAKQALSKFGSVDLLINNVGGPPPSAAESTSLQEWQAGFNQIFLSTVLLTQSLIPSMKAKNYGRIVTITSLSVFEPIEHLVVSTTMRTAVTTFMKTLSKEVAAYGITANTVLPGVIHTDRIINLRKAKAERTGTTLELELEKTTKTIPMARLGRPEELADLVAFLASERASYITGANIPVDGGMRSSWT